MAGPFIVNNPSITWAGSPVASPGISWQSATINQSGETSDYLTATNTNARIPHLRSWGGSINGFLATPTSGKNLSVSFSTATDGYFSYVEQFSLNVSVESKPYYTSDGSNDWMSALPSTLKWAASYVALVEDTTAIEEVGSASSPTEVVFTVSTGNTLTGNMLSSSVDSIVPIGDYSKVTVSLEGSGDLVASGSNNIFDATTIAAMDPATLTIVAKDMSTDADYAGSAFWTSLGVQVADNANIAYDIGFQGTGALTITAGVA